MKPLLAIVGVIAIATMIFFVHNNQSNKTDSVDRYDAIKQDVADGAQLLDVRTPEEFSEGHIKEAVNLPLQQIQAGEEPRVDKDSTLYVYCRSGNRSAQAAAILRDGGYNVKDLGGMSAVAAMGGEVVNDCC